MATIYARSMRFREFNSPYGIIRIPFYSFEGNVYDYNQYQIEPNKFQPWREELTVLISYQNKTPITAEGFQIQGVNGIFTIKLNSALSKIIINTPSNRKIDLTFQLTSAGNGYVRGIFQDSGGTVFRIYNFPTPHVGSGATTEGYGFTEISDSYEQVTGSLTHDETLYNELTDLFLMWEKIPIDSDPFKPGGETDVGGGTGDFDGTTEAIEKPSLPSLSAVSAGFVSLYNPSLSQINALASYMWSDAFSLDTFKKLFADPMDAILGLNIVPVQPSVGETTNVKIGNISTDISMPPISSQYVERDCGTLEVKEYWGAYLDYEPFTRAELYLPYIGIRQISVDDIMGKTVQVIYHIDILSGACVAYVICSGTVLYSFSGQCAATIPMTGADWTNVVNGVISIAASVVGLAAGGGAMAAGVLGGVASTAVNQMKPDIQKSGSLSGVGGLLGVQTPYLILTRPRQAVPARQNTFRGYPSFITVKLGDLSGYTEIESIHLENVPATSEELGEINALLREGVIF